MWSSHCAFHLLSSRINVDKFIFFNQPITCLVLVICSSFPSPSSAEDCCHMPLFDSLWFSSLAPICCVSLFPSLIIHDSMHFCYSYPVTSPCHLDYNTTYDMCISGACPPPNNSFHPNRPYTGTDTSNDPQDQLLATFPHWYLTCPPCFPCCLSAIRAYMTGYIVRSVVS